MIRTLLRSGLVLLGLLSLPTGAFALGLDVLASGGTLDSGNGLLTFSDFEVVASGSVSSNLALYDVESLADGLAISGSIDAAGGTIGDLFIQFTVRSRAPLARLELTLDAEASGEGSSASVTETLEEREDALLFVFKTGDEFERLSQSLRLRGATELRVSKDILVDSSENGTARVIRIEQHFSEAPEAAAPLLFGLALLGGAALRSRAA